MQQEAEEVNVKSKKRGRSESADLEAPPKAERFARLAQALQKWAAKAQNLQAEVPAQAAPASAPAPAPQAPAAAAPGPPCRRSRPLKKQRVEEAPPCPSPEIASSKFTLLCIVVMDST